jgi:hypothetical protein
MGWMTGVQFLVGAGNFPHSAEVNNMWGYTSIPPGGFAFLTLGEISTLKCYCRRCHYEGFTEDLTAFGVVGTCTFV